MAFKGNPVSDRLSDSQSMTLGKRFLLITLVCCLQAIYIPTSNFMTGGIEPKLPIDIFPIWSVWVLPYVMCYGLWLAGIAWAIFKVKDPYFRSFVAAFVLTCTLAVLTFILFPTYVKPAVIPGTDLFSTLLRFIHQNWGRYDAFPSGHIYITVLLSLFYHRWYPRYKFYWVLIPILVSFSTLFTGQHYMADIAGGLVVAFLGYRYGLIFAGFPLLPIRSRETRLLEPPS